MTAPVLLIHGGFHGAWCWERLIGALAERDVEAEAVDLPFTTFADDVAVIEAAIDRLGADGARVVAVGHSLGGLHLTAAGAGRDGHVPAAHLVYLTAAMIAPEDVPASGDQPAWDHISYDGDLARPDPVRSAALFYSGCDADDAAWAAARLRPVLIAGMNRPIGEFPVAWRSIPSTYIVCTRDRMLLPERQRAMAARAGTSLELDADHSPFLSRTSELADMLASLSRSVAGR